MPLVDSHPHWPPMQRVNPSKRGKQFPGSACYRCAPVNYKLWTRLNRRTFPNEQAFYRADHSPAVLGRRSWIIAGKRVCRLLASGRRRRYAGAGHGENPQRPCHMPASRSPEVTWCPRPPWKDGIGKGFGRNGLPMPLPHRMTRWKNVAGGISISTAGAREAPEFFFPKRLLQYGPDANWARCGTKCGIFTPAYKPGIQSGFCAVPRRWILFQRCARGAAPRGERYHRHPLPPGVFPPDQWRGA